MAAADNIIEFRRSLRGYDTDDVDRQINDLHARLAELETERQEQSRLVRRLSRDLAEAQERATVAKPNFSELGVQFEETLRVAEAQADKMLSEARAKADAVLTQSRTEAAEQRAQAATEAEEMLSEAKRHCDRLRFDTDAELVRLRQQAADETAKAKAASERADRHGAQTLSRAEREAAEHLAEARRAAEQIERDAAELLHQAQQKAAEIDAQTRERQADAERTRTSILADADAYAERAYNDAEGTIAAASERASVLNAEAGVIVERAREHARLEVEHARSYADRLIGDALARAGALSKDTDETMQNLVADGELHAADLRRQLSTIDDFTQRVRILAAESSRSEEQAREAARRLRDRENEVTAAPRLSILSDLSDTDAEAEPENDVLLAFETEQDDEARD